MSEHYSEVPLDISIQHQVESYAEQFLSQGRFDWDLPHTKAVVYYAVLLSLSENLNSRVLFTSAWFHDIGYYGLFEDSESSANWGDIKDRKALHMVKGKRMAEEFLARPEIAQHYTLEERGRIPYLVSVHDEVAQLSEPDELVLMEADTLGAIDVSRVTPTFDYESYLKYRQSGLEKRRKRFTTELGKKLFEQLVPKFDAHFDTEQENSN